MSLTKEQKKWFLEKMNQIKNKPLTKEQKLQIWSEAKAKYGDITFSILEVPIGLLPIEGPLSLHGYSPEGWGGEKINISGKKGVLS